MAGLAATQIVVDGELRLLELAIALAVLGDAGSGIWQGSRQVVLAHVAAVAGPSQWLYVDGFVRPKSGASWRCLLPTVITQAIAAALATFARDKGSDATHRAVVLSDQAGWHASQDWRLPDRIDLVCLPPYSPQGQPVERLWPLGDEPLANGACAHLGARETVLVDRCRMREADPRRLKAQTHFHGWPPEPVTRKTL